MASKRLDPNASLADYKEHVARKQPMGNTKPKEHSARKTPMGNTKPKEHLAQKRTKIDKAIANAQAFQKQRTALINMSTKDKLGSALEAGIIGAATGGGIVAAQKGIRAAANTGIPARIGNRVTGQKVVVHGSPITGMKKIEPRSGSNQLPEKTVMFGWDPQKKGMDERITRAAGQYITKNQSGKPGSVYVAKIKKSEIVTPQSLLNTPQVVSKSSAKVVKEIPVSNKSFKQLDDEVKKQLRLSGAPARPYVSRTADTAEKTINKLKQTFQTQAQKDAARRRRVR